MSDCTDNQSSSEDEDYVPDVKDESDDSNHGVVNDESVNSSDGDNVSKEEVDKIWEEFKSNASKTETTANFSQIDAKSNLCQFPDKNGPDSISSSASNSQLKDTVTITKVYDFAGENVEITKVVNKKELVSKTKMSTASSCSFPNSKRKGGLQGILGKMEKRPKLSTLEKSKLDWQSYKKEEGIEDELKIYNKGKGGYVEKQLFLERTDFRQFEKERDIRLGKISKR